MKSQERVEIARTQNNMFIEQRCCFVWAGLLDCPHALPDRLASVVAAQLEEAADG